MILKRCLVILAVLASMFFVTACPIDYLQFDIVGNWKNITISHDAFGQVVANTYSFFQFNADSTFVIKIFITNEDDANPIDIIDTGTYERGSSHLILHHETPSVQIKDHYYRLSETRLDLMITGSTSSYLLPFTPIPNDIGEITNVNFRDF